MEHDIADTRAPADKDTERRTAIPTGKCRVIKISKEAIYEYLRECVTEDAEVLFGIPDSTAVVSAFDIDFERGEFIAFVRPVDQDDEIASTVKLMADPIDTETLMREMPDTTDSLFVSGRFAEIDDKELPRVT